MKDRTDELIEHLKEEVKYLRARNEMLEARPLPYVAPIVVEKPVYQPDRFWVGDGTGVTGYPAAWPSTTTI